MAESQATDPGADALFPDTHAAADPQRPTCIMAATGRSVTYGELVAASRAVRPLLWSRGPVADPEVVPDVWEFADDPRGAHEEIRDAAGIRATSTRRSNGTAGRKRAAKAMADHQAQVRPGTSGS